MRYGYFKYLPDNKWLNELRENKEIIIGFYETYIEPYKESKKDKIYKWIMNVILGD
jgi:hypothetical protein